MNAVVAILCVVGCEAETSEWLEPTLAHATPSPFIAIMDADTLDEVMTPHWQKGDWWVVESYYFTDGVFGRNEWQHSHERFEVTALPAPDLDYYLIEIRTISPDDERPPDHMSHALALRRDPLSVAKSAPSLSVREGEHGKEYGGINCDSPGRNPFTPPFDRTRPLGFPSRVGMHGTYFATWDDTPYRQSVIALGDWVVFHAVPVGDVQGTLVQTHTFEWRRGDPWWSTYRRSVQVHAKSGPPGAFAEEVLGVARLLSVGGKPTGYAMPKREPPPEECNH